MKKFKTSSPPQGVIVKLYHSIFGKAMIMIKTISLCISLAALAIAITALKRSKR